MRGVPESWNQLSAGKRVRAVIETMDSPSTISEISEKAEVETSTTLDEVGRLSSENLVREIVVDGQKRYETNPIGMYFEEIRRLNEGHSYDELAARLANLREQQRQLVEKFNVESFNMSRGSMVNEAGISAREQRERERIASTWEALDTELNLIRHSMRMRLVCSSERARC